MANVETTDAAVSNVQLDADSLEFAVNTNLSLMANNTSPKGASPSLQELIEAELNVRLCQPDSLEPPASPDPSSILSCDSIEPAPPTLAPSPTPVKTRAPATNTALSLDSLVDLDSLKDSIGQADTESGIDLLSPTKLDNLSNLDMDSLESSSDLPASSSHSSPEPTALLVQEDLSLPQQETHLLVVEAGNPLLLRSGDKSFPDAEVPRCTLLENERDDVSEEDLQTAPPLLRISESDLTLAECRSEVSQEVTRGSTPDSLTSYGASSEGASVPRDSATPQNSIASEDDTTVHVILQSATLQNSADLQNTVSSTDCATFQGSGFVLESATVQKTVEIQESVTLKKAVEIQETVSQDDIKILDSSAPQDIKVHLDSVTEADSVALSNAYSVTRESLDSQESVGAQGSAASLDTEAPKEAGERTGASRVVEGLGTAKSDQSPSQVTAELTPSLLPTDLVSPTSLSSPTGALPQSGTNSVCGGDLFNAARDDCGVGSGGDEATTAAVCSSSDGVGGVSGPITSRENGTNMEQQIDDDEDDFWGSRNDDDDLFVPRRRPEPEYGQDEDDSFHQYSVKEEEVEDEGNGNHVIGVDEDDDAMDDFDAVEGDDDISARAIKGLRFKRKTVIRTEQTIGGNIEEKKTKKKLVEEVGKENGVMEEKKKKEKEEMEKEKEKKEKLKEKEEKLKKEKEKVVTEDVIEEETIMEEEVTGEKKKKKKRSTEDGEKEKSKKKKKKKRRESEKENKEASASSSANELESEEEAPPAPTPPLYNGHALLHDSDGGNTNAHKIMRNETHNDEEPLICNESFSKESFHSLVDAYNKEGSLLTKEPRAHTPLSDEEELAGVSVKQLRVSYLSATKDTSKLSSVTHKTDIKEEIKANLHTTVNISTLVDTYSTPQRRPVTPTSRPDDLTPVSLQSLKSAYEATATGATCAGSRYSSSSSSSPAGGSPAPKEELNVSLHQLREEYCRSVQDGLSRNHTPSKASLDTGVSIRHLQVSQVSSECRQCGKQVFQMEKIVAEKAAWHKNCFRCKECSCILTLETYQSHEGVLYCKPHFKELFRPKVVVEDPDEARRERSSNKPDYGLDDLSTSSNLKQKFAMFEHISTEEDRIPETIPVRRSHSLLSKAARFMQNDDDDYGIENAELGEYEEDEDDDDEEEDEEEGEGGDEDLTQKKSRSTSFTGIKDLKAGFARKNRRDELSRRRRQELAKFRQMLCAGKNISTREMFEGGNLEDGEGHLQRKEQIKIEGSPDAKNLRERFEKGLSVAEDDEDEREDRREVDRVFKEAETASKARNLFKEIDKTVAEGGEPVMRPKSSSAARRENRLSQDGNEVEDLELGRDPNLIKYSDNYEDEVDCRGTRSLLAKFRKLEMKSGDRDAGPRPLKRFTPPPEGEDYDSDEEYSDEEYTDDDDEDSEDDSEEDEDDEQTPKYKDEVLEMVKSSQSARKAASLRAKFEKWETEVERNNEYNQNDKYEDEEECMPSIDTARNLRAMFENKAQEVTRPADNRPKVKVNRFVGGGGDKCMLCDRTVYAMERLEVAGRVLHKNCFKCCKCSTKLSMNTFSIGGEDMYCTTHYKQAFTEKGTYDVFTPSKGLPVRDSPELEG